MSRKHSSAIAAGLAAIAMVGVLPGAAHAQLGRRDQQEGQRRDDRSDQREDRRRDDRSDRRDDQRDDRRDNRYDRRDDRRDDWNDNRDNRRTSRDEAEHRQTTKNEWRNLAIAAAGVSAFGLIQKEPTIAFAGAAGALYSLNRYEQDRRSQSTAARARVGIFSQPYFTRDGTRYDRREVTRDGQRYYQFMRR